MTPVLSCSNCGASLCSILELFSYQRLSHQTGDLDITNFSIIARAGNTEKMEGVSQRSAVTTFKWRFIVWLPTLCVVVVAANRVALQVPRRLQTLQTVLTVTLLLHAYP